MFPYYKRKVYRSTQGCCICKGKSSSSRFTDSKKYETDFIECFQLSTPRKGEICNACVLVVKRFKRLPPGSDRHWGHVVDARVGPGFKSMTKFKKRKEEQMLLQQNGIPKELAKTASNQNAKTLSSVSEGFRKIFKKTKKKQLQEVEKRDASPSSTDVLSPSPSSPDSVPTDSENVYVPFEEFDESDNVNNRINQRMLHTKHQRKSRRPLKNRSHINASVIDNDFWMKKETCCGNVYENKLIGAVMIDSMCSSTCKWHNMFCFPTAEIVCIPDDNVMQTASQTDAFPKADSFLNADQVEKTDISTKTDVSTITDVSTKTDLKNDAFVQTDIFAQTNICAEAERIAQNDAFNSQILEMFANNAALKSGGAVDISTNSIRGAKFETMKHIASTSIINNYKLSKLEESSSNMSTRAHNYLHKIKANTSKITTINKLPTKGKSCDIDVVKNLVKFCHEKSAKLASFAGKLGSGANNEKLNEVLGTKMNENSSDSGYDEISHTQESSQKSRISAIRPSMMSNKIKIQVQPQNLVMAATIGLQTTGMYTTSTTPGQSQFISVPQNDIMQNVITSTTSNKIETLQHNNQTNLNNLNPNLVALHQSVYTRPQIEGKNFT